MMALRIWLFISIVCWIGGGRVVWANNLHEQKIRSIVAPYVMDVKSDPSKAPSRAGLRLSLSASRDLPEKVSYRLEAIDQMGPINRVNAEGLKEGTYEIVIFGNGQESFRSKFIAFPYLLSDLHLDYMKDIGFSLKQSINLPALQFVKSKSRIQKASFPVLDDLVLILSDQKSLQMLSIRVHTDSGGSEAKNLELTQARADQIKAYLKNHGIAGTRLVARGMGSSQPLQKELTYEDRLQNRRVEYIIEQIDTKTMIGINH